MAWQGWQGYGTHQYRKESAAHGRSGSNRAALVDGENKSGSKRKRPRCDARKFGIEYRPKDGVMTFLKSRGWRPYYAWYETQKQRDQAFEALKRKDRFYDYRILDRGKDSES